MQSLLIFGNISIGKLVVCTSRKPPDDVLGVSLLLTSLSSQRSCEYENDNHPLILPQLLSAHLTYRNPAQEIGQHDRGNGLGQSQSAVIVDAKLVVLLRHGCHVSPCQPTQARVDAHDDEEGEDEDAADGDEVGVGEDGEKRADGGVSDSLLFVPAHHREETHDEGHRPSHYACAGCRTHGHQRQVFEGILDFQESARKRKMPDALIRSVMPKNTFGMAAKLPCR